MCLRPQMIVQKRRISKRDREQSDLARTLTLYADATKSWISKGVRFPVATLEQVQYFLNTLKILIRPVYIHTSRFEYALFVVTHIFCFVLYGFMQLQIAFLFSIS